MPYRDPDTMHWIRAAVYVCLAFVGGALAYMLRSMHNKEKIDKGRLFVEAASSAFVGLLVMMLCQEFDVSPQLTGMAVGVFGWLGATATIQVLERIIYSRLGITKGSKPNQPPE